MWWTEYRLKIGDHETLKNELAYTIVCSKSWGKDQYVRKGFKGLENMTDEELIKQVKWWMTPNSIEEMISDGILVIST